MAKVSIKVRGYGKQVPPDKSFVIIWFLEKGGSELTAISFYKFYQSRKWCNNHGKTISDWKMRAWDWLWSKPF
ncbi:hypothetical protein SAMN05192574_103560 [Mucilaginibacter gossypiicola]|uniref:Uncharacterized protein n=1 Tax=Mucilaginibacter gossypiicola TaxID=551995 RepID=A0A1H8HM63_9SPHI|nr:hypothetical protein [Mucilaginibacter gossypiicola]SEN57259.1 hypothetical protein SAMN05192574_103560 [Mucilaginibacter gossypiicola]